MFISPPIEDGKRMTVSPFDQSDKIIYISNPIHWTDYYLCFYECAELRPRFIRFRDLEYNDLLAPAKYAAMHDYNDRFEHLSSVVRKALLKYDWST